MLNNRIAFYIPLLQCVVLTFIPSNTSFIVSCNSAITDNESLIFFAPLYKEHRVKCLFTELRHVIFKNDSQPFFQPKFRCIDPIFF